MQFELDQVKAMLDIMPGNHLTVVADNGSFYGAYATPGIWEMAGLPVPESRSILHPLDIILEEDRDVISSKLNAYLKSMGSADSSFLIDYVFRLIHPVQGFIWAHMTASYLGTIDGNNAFVATLVDVTKEMLNSYSLMEASDRYICVIEKATKRFLYANARFYDLIDSNSADAMGKHCYELLCRVLEMKDNDNCLCYSSINADPPIEYYNADKDMHISMTGREIIWGEHESYVFFLTDVSAIKRANEALVNSQKLFDVALMHSDLMVWEYDMVNNLCINSEKAGKDYNIPRVIENYPEALYETGHVPPESIEQIKEVKKRLQAGETDFSVERRTVDKYGRSQWQKIDYALEKDENGTPVRAIMCGLDITARKELEAKYESQMEYRDNLAANALFSARLDLDADTVVDYTCRFPQLEEYVSTHRSATSFLADFFVGAGFSGDTNIGYDDLQIDALKEAYDLGRAEIKTEFHEATHNRYLSMSIGLSRNPGTGHLETFLVAGDMTEERLMQSVFHVVVTKDYEMVSVVNAHTGEMDVVSSSGGGSFTDRKLTYEQRVDALLKQFKGTFESDDEYHLLAKGMKLDTVIESLEHTSVYELTFRSISDKDIEHTYRLSFAYADQEKHLIVFAQSDISGVVAEERRAQKALQNALDAAEKANHAKTDFLSRMSHDMRTPMNGIIGMTNLTLDMPDLPEEARENLHAISDSSGFLLQLINDTLDMNKIESNRFTLNYETVNAGELIRNIIATVKPLADAKDIEFTFVPINAQLEYIRVDRTRIQQLFLNILSNAIKFTPVGGHICLEVECLKRENGIAYDRISVTDDGCGMSPEFLTHAFEPFTQENTSIARQQQGTGLGMSIVKNLVELMGGTVEAESTLGKGTKITAHIQFERVYDPEMIKAATTAPTVVGLKGKRVLLAEDNALNAIIAKKLLEKKGMVIEHAENGKDAVEMFSDRVPGYYDAILMDIRMPELDGLSAARAIRSLDHVDASSIPIIAMTANAYTEDVEAALDAGMNAHIAKPIDSEILYRTLERYA